MIGMGTTIFLVNPVNFGGGGFTNDYSLLFDGVDEYVDCNAVTELVSTQNVSFSFWMKQSGNGHILGTNFDASNRIGAIVQGNQPYFFIDGSYGVTSGVTSLNVWVHVALVFDGTQTGNANRCKIYVNGTNETLSFSGTIPSTTSASLSGVDFNIGTFTIDYMSGYLDEVRIYDYSLSSGDVTSIYNLGVPKEDDLSTAAVHYWRCGDGDTFSTINDVGTTGGNNGTMTNMESGDIQTDVP